VKNIKTATDAIAAARKALQTLTDETVEAGKKDARQFKALPKLANVDNALVKAAEKLEDAAKAVAPKVAKEKKADKK
jgi:hypothetical protein